MIMHVRDELSGEFGSFKLMPPPFRTWGIMTGCASMTVGSLFGWFDGGRMSLCGELLVQHEFPKRKWALPRLLMWAGSIRRSGNARNKALRNVFIGLARLSLRRCLLHVFFAGARPFGILLTVA